MRKLLFCLLVLSIGFVSCESVNIEGEGEVVTKTIDFDTLTIHSVELLCDGDVHLIVSDDPRVELRSHQNILDHIKVVNNDGVVTIDTYYENDEFSNYDVLNYYVYVSDLELVRLVGEGNIYSAVGLDVADDLTLIIEGSGDMHLDLSAATVSATATGSGDLELQLDANKLTCSSSGSGDLELSGSVTEASYDMSGSGECEAFDLYTDITTCEISGSGDAELNVEETLVVVIKGSGDVSYKGTPAITQSISGSGELKNAN